VVIHEGKYHTLTVSDVVPIIRVVGIQGLRCSHVHGNRLFAVVDRTGSKHQEEQDGSSVEQAWKTVGQDVEQHWEEDYVGDRIE
jgi:hypothetical protein